MRGAALGLTVLFAVTGCATAPKAQPTAVSLTIDGLKLADAPDLQAQAEAQLAYTLDYGYVARAGAAAISCWFAKTGLEVRGGQAAVVRTGPGTGNRRRHRLGAGADEGSHQDR